MRLIKESKNTEKLLTVLLVEDNDTAGLYMSVLLKRMNCQVIHALTGEEAVEKFNADVDGVLMDLGLPGIDGYEAARRIREHQPGNTPMFACSAFDKDCERRCIQAGMDGFMQKPCSEDLLKYFVGELSRKKFNKESRWLKAI